MNIYPSGPLHKDEVKMRKVESKEQERLHKKGLLFSGGKAKHKALEKARVNNPKRAFKGKDARMEEAHWNMIESRQKEIRADRRARGVPE